MQSLLIVTSICYLATSQVNQHWHRLIGSRIHSASIGSKHAVLLSRETPRPGEKAVVLGKQLVHAKHIPC